MKESNTNQVNLAVFSRLREVRREIKQTERYIENYEEQLAKDRDSLNRKKAEKAELELFLEQEGVDITPLSDADAFMRNEE